MYSMLVCSVPMSPSSNKTHSQLLPPSLLAHMLLFQLYLDMPVLFKMYANNVHIFRVYKNRLPQVNCSLRLLNLDLINKLWSTWFSESFASLIAKCH